VKRIVVLFALISFLCTLLVGCYTVEDSVAAAMLESKEKIEAVEFPELILTDYIGREREVKILSVQGRIVTITPFPYWLLEPEEIPLWQIESLKVKRHSYPGVNMTLVSAEMGFIAAGGIAGAIADESLEYTLAIGGGLLGALVGVGCAFFSDVWQMGDEMYPEYYLAGMSEPDQMLTILRLMGVL
jgi:hypothetical protein